MANEGTIIVVLDKGQACPGLLVRRDAESLGAMCSPHELHESRRLYDVV